MKRPTSNPSPDNSFAEKWSPAVARRGFYMKPRCLVQCINDLGLSKEEVLVLDCLLVYWYEAASVVWPAKATIAGSLGMGVSTVATHIRSLEYKGFIEREHKNGDSNRYHLSGTVLKVKQHVNDKHPAHIRAGPSSKLSSYPYSDVSTKEYNLKRRNNKKVASVDNILRDMHGDIYPGK